MNFKSFVCLNKLFLLKQKLQACWTILYNSGYDSSLSLTEDYIKQKSPSNFDPSTPLELSDDGIEFLRGLWKLYSRSKEAHVSIVNKIFATMKEGCPFVPSEVTIIRNEQIKLKAWINIWQMLVHTNYKLAFRYALYLGYEGNLKKFVKVIKNNWNLFDKLKKSIYECIVIGKLPIILNSILESVVSEGPRSGVFKLSKHEALVVTEVDEQALAFNKAFNRYSACSLVYDGTTESGNFIKSVYKKLPKQLPTAIIDVSNEVEAHSPLEGYLEYFRKKSLPIFKLRIPLENPNGLIEFIGELIKKR